MARKRKTPIVAVFEPKEMTPGDAQYQVHKDMLRLQEVIIEKLAFIEGVKMVNKSPIILEIPEAAAREKGIPSVVSPTRLSLPVLMQVAKALEVDMALVQSKEAWLFLYKIEV